MKMSFEGMMDEVNINKSGIRINAAVPMRKIQMSASPTVPRIECFILLFLIIFTSTYIYVTSSDLDPLICMPVKKSMMINKRTLIALARPIL